MLIILLLSLSLETKREILPINQATSTRQPPTLLPLFQTNNPLQSPTFPMIVS